MINQPAFLLLFSNCFFVYEKAMYSLEKWHLEITIIIIITINVIIIIITIILIITTTSIITAVDNTIITLLLLRSTVPVVSYNANRSGYGAYDTNISCCRQQNQ